jgi:hypothetical protein
MFFMRRLVPLVILVALVISTCAAGCTSNSDQQDPKLKAYVSELHNVTLEKAANVTKETNKLTRWNETWIDSSTINVDAAIENATFLRYTNFTVKRFGSIDNAATFMKSKKRTGSSITCPSTPSLFQLLARF